MNDKFFSRPNSQTTERVGTINPRVNHNRQLCIVVKINIFGSFEKRRHVS